MPSGAGPAALIQQCVLLKVGADANLLSEVTGNYVIHFSAPIARGDCVDVIQVRNENLIWQHLSGRGFQGALQTQTEERRTEGVALLAPFPLLDFEHLARVIRPEVHRGLRIKHGHERQ